jgi:acetyltransferase-like isoleucine patch superfamily enzyme
MKQVLKRLFQGLCAAWTLPLALLSGFGRVRSAYRFGAHAVAQAPGIVGDYLRVAYYCWTLEECARESRVEFGSFFAHPEARMAAGVYVGPYTVLGRVRIGEGCQIASGVQVLSGRRQHRRGEGGELGGGEQGEFTTVRIGARCWIGAGAIVMADVGDGVTVGAGAVVVKPLPDGVVAVGNPARVLEG